MLSHSVGNHICLTVKQDRMLKGIAPVIIVCKPAKTCLYSTDDHRNILVGMPDQIAIYNGGVIGSLSHNTTGRISIDLTFLFGNIIVIHHRIHISCRYQKSKSGFSVNGNALIIFPVRLGYDPNGIAVGFQNTADNGMSKRRMVYVSIPDDIYKIKLVKTPVKHILSCEGQKSF